MKIPMTPILKSATIEDVKQLAEIEWAVSSAPWSVQQFSDCIEQNNPAYVLEQDNKIIGFIIYHLIAGQCEIYNIAIHLDFQGQGWGKYLLEQAIIAARTKCCESIFLEVRANNLPARKLYQTVGFNEIGLRKGYYKMNHGGREDAVMMAMDLFYE